MPMHKLYPGHLSPKTHAETAAWMGSAAFKLDEIAHEIRTAYGPSSRRFHAALTLASNIQKLAKQLQDDTSNRAL